VRRVACRPDEDVGGDAVTEAGSGQLSSASLSAAAVYVSSTAGHPQSSVAELEQDTTCQMTLSLKTRFSQI